MFKYFFIFIFLLSFTNSHSENKDKIIEKLKNTKNLVFEFEQNINGKIENGNCTIQYPKKIYCKYFKKDLTHSIPSTMPPSSITLFT